MTQQVELSPVGRKGFIKVERGQISMPVQVTGYRKVFGRVEVLVTPEPFDQNLGSAWVNKEKFFE